MNWTYNIQTALKYIESHLGEKELSAERVAEQVYFSNVHFSRAFHILTGLSVAEYIRNRRLSVAGERLQKGDSTMLKVSLDLGYESPEAFGKAFKRFHGVNPSDSSTSELKSFHPMELELVVTQVKSLNWRVEKKSAIYLNGSTKWVSEEDDLETSHLWKISEKSGYLDKCYGFEGFEALVGVFSHDGYTIKAKCKIPVEGDVLILPEQKWVIFSCDGEMPEAINKTWNRIYAQWLPGIEFTISELPQLEIYHETDQSYTCEIWIPIVGL